MTGLTLRRTIMALAALIGIVAISFGALKQCSTAPLDVDTQTNPGSSSATGAPDNGRLSGNAGAGNLPERSVPTSVDPNYSEPSSVTDWDSHNLVFLGENFIPVGDAYSTPFATFYRIDKNGYIPSTPIGPVNTDGPCHKKWYASSRAAGVHVIGEMKEAAIDAAARGNSAQHEVVPGCPRDLGSGWEAGSYVFDEHGTDLAGFEFKHDARFYEVLDQLGRKYIVVPEGGKGPKDDPAMKKMKLEVLLVDDSGYPDDHDHEDAMKDIQDRIPGGQGGDVNVKYLPAKSDYENSDDLDDATLAAVQKELEALIERHRKKVRKTSSDGPGKIAVHLRMQSYSAEQLAEQQKRIDAKLKKILDEVQAKIDKTVTAISLGNELTTCQRLDAACRAMQNSIAVYLEQEQ